MSEVENKLAVPERRAKTHPIEAQNAAIARAMASICNDEWGCFGVQSGHGKFFLSLSDYGKRQLWRGGGAATVAKAMRAGRERGQRH